MGILNRPLPDQRILIAACLNGSRLAADSLWNYQRTEGRCRRKHPGVSREVESRRRHQRRQQFQRLIDDMRRSVPPAVLEPVQQPAVGQGRQPFAGQRRAACISREAFEAPLIMHLLRPIPWRFVIAFQSSVCRFAPPSPELLSAARHFGILRNPRACPAPYLTGPSALAAGAKHLLPGELIRGDRTIPRLPAPGFLPHFHKRNPA